MLNSPGRARTVGGGGVETHADGSVRVDVHLGFGRIVVSEIEAPTILVNLV